MKAKSALEAFIFTTALSSACSIPVNNLEVSCPKDYHLAQSDLRANIAVDLMIGGGRQKVAACLNDTFTSPEQLEAQCVQENKKLIISKETGVHTWGCLPDDHK